MRHNPRKIKNKIVLKLLHSKFLNPAYEVVDNDSL